MNVNRSEPRLLINTTSSSAIFFQKQQWPPEEESGYQFNCCMITKDKAQAQSARTP